ncbi:MAG: DNA/RNA nuclease SfsA [Clostridia bacterium]|nr:DNA/RNA nuclease SfsA [Clostridia bacterium]
MKYKNIIEGKFISRPNRFIAKVDIDGKECICHVKNTGRCKELLTNGAAVYLEKSDNPERKTLYDLVAVYKGNELFNIDSQAPNKVFYEWLQSGKSCFENITFIKPECKYKNSRFDFYVEADGKRLFIEVKGVTLEINGVLTFPDAPTERGAKHLTELGECLDEGYGAMAVFVVQTKRASYFTPNIERDPNFAKQLKAAYQKGVEVICLNCNVTPDTLDIDDYVEVKIDL